MQILLKGKGTSQNVLKMIKCQRKNSKLINKDHIVDSKSAMMLCEKICFSTSEIPGYVQEIVESPFGISLFNNIQVNFCFLLIFLKSVLR